MKKILSSFADLVFVPRCAACDERLAVATGALCPQCRERYELALLAPCPFCGKVLSSCLCRGPALEGTSVKGLLKVFLYQAIEGEAPPPQNALLYRLKHHGDRRVVNELADRLAEAIRPHLEALPKDLLVTYAPRSRRARLRYGFDHMAYLSAAVASRLALPCASLLIRRGGKEQKKSGSRTARFRNMEAAYRYHGHAPLDGRPILLLDDISTSGATLAAAARTLRGAGASAVYAAVAAYTPPRE